MNWIKGHWKIVLIVLLGIFLFFKSCQSCSRKQEIAFYRYDADKTIDSLRCEMALLQDSINILNTEIVKLEGMVSAYSKENASLQDNNQYLRQINNKIINYSKE